MRKTVIVYEVYETPIEVDADNDEEALDIVDKWISMGVDDDGNVLPNGEYSYGLDKSKWDVFDSYIDSIT